MWKMQDQGYNGPNFRAGKYKIWKMAVLGTRNVARDIRLLEPK